LIGEKETQKGGEKKEREKKIDEGRRAGKPQDQRAGKKTSSARQAERVEKGRKGKELSFCRRKRHLTGQLQGRSPREVQKGKQKIQHSLFLVGPEEGTNVQRRISCRFAATETWTVRKHNPWQVPLSGTGGLSQDVDRANRGQRILKGTTLYWWARVILLPLREISNFPEVGKTRGTLTERRGGREGGEEIERVESRRWRSCLT